MNRKKKEKKNPNALLLVNEKPESILVVAPWRSLVDHLIVGAFVIFLRRRPCAGFGVPPNVGLLVDRGGSDAEDSRWQTRPIPAAVPTFCPNQGNPDNV